MRTTRVHNHGILPKSTHHRQPISLGARTSILRYLKSYSIVNVNFNFSFRNSGLQVIMFCHLMYQSHCPVFKYVILTVNIDNIIYTPRTHAVSSTSDIYGWCSMASFKFFPPEIIIANFFR